MSSNYLKVAQKYLTSKVFIEDGFEYKFRDIHQFKEHVDEIRMTIDVILPNPNQSWVAPKFTYDIQNILQGLSNFIGSSFSVSYITMLNGKDIEDYGYCYVSPEKQIEILEALNSQISKVTLKQKMGKTEFNVSWVRRNGRNYSMDDGYFNFYFYLELYDLKFNDKSVKPNMDMIDDLAGTLGDNLLDKDSFRERAENIIYTVLEPEIKIKDVDDCYFQINTYVDKVDGIKVNPNSSHFGVTPEMFKL